MPTRPNPKNAIRNRKRSIKKEIKNLEEKQDTTDAGTNIKNRIRTLKVEYQELSDIQNGVENYNVRIQSVKKNMIEETHKKSGYYRKKITMVQGGAPGTGKKS